MRSIITESTNGFRARSEAFCRSVIKDVYGGVAPLAIVIVLMTACNEVVAPPNPRSGAPFRIGSTLVQSDGRIIYGAPPGFTETSRATVRGTRNVRGGCTWHDKSQGATGEHVTLAVVELDPATCDFTVATGKWVSLRPTSSLQVRVPSATVNTSSLPTSVANDVQWGSCDSADGYVCDEGIVYDTDSGGGSSGSGYAEQYITVWDPVNYSVLEDGNLIQYTYDTSTYCFTHSWGKYRRVRDRATGWRLFNANTWAGGMTCDSARGTEYATYQNSWFCEITPWPGTVYVEFINTVTAHLLTSSEFDASVSIDGGCSNMLHYTVDRWY